MNRDESLYDDTASLARLLDVSDEGLSPWDPKDLADILAHQLAAPLAADLVAVEGGPAALCAAEGTSGLPLRTFHDLFSHPHPPEELLHVVKRFAKRCRRQPDSPLPDEIASVLYFLAIIVARLRLGKRISGLDEQALCAGLQWALGQPCLDKTTRTLLADGLASLRA